MRKAATPPWEPHLERSPKRIPKHNGMLEVEHLVVELVDVDVNKDELVGKVPSKDGLHNGHSHVADANHGDFVVALGWKGRSRVGYSFKVSL